MIRAHDEGTGKPGQPFNPREMLQRMERLLSQTRTPRQKRADESQQLVYDAWEAETDEREHELMCQALELNPGNADALLYMLDGAGLDEEAEIQALRNIVAAAAKNLGPRVFKQNAGHFWGFSRTPMRWAARRRRSLSPRSCAPPGPGTRRRCYGSRSSRSNRRPKPNLRRWSFATTAPF